MNIKGGKAYLMDISNQLLDNADNISKRIVKIIAYDTTTLES